MSSYTNVILPLVTAESNDPLILWLKNHILLSSSMDCEHCSNPMYQKIQSELGFEHHSRVNHSKRFVAPDGTHTQNIESYWNRIKQLIKRMNGCHRDFLHWYLQEFMCRERFNEGNFFLNFVEHISLFYRV